MHTAVSWIGFLLALAQHCFLRCDTLVGLKEMTSEFIQIGLCWLLFPLQAVLGNVFLQYDSWELLYKVENKRRGTTQFVINNQKCSHEFTVVPTWRLTKSQLSEQLSSLAWKCLFFFCLKLQRGGTDFHSKFWRRLQESKLAMSSVWIGKNPRDRREHRVLCMKTGLRAEVLPIIPYAMGVKFMHSRNQQKVVLFWQCAAHSCSKNRRQLPAPSSDRLTPSAPPDCASWHSHTHMITRR